ncbi:MAG: pyridoxamine 5'-phosphate oxidase family protein [Betaproteobacteria bacterium]|nr:pyridoxamine 5'-phosphate oxidase family protein [Betaproteobacteria bacterium]
MTHAVSHVHTREHCVARIETVEHLRQIIGEPRPAVTHKFNRDLTPQAREFLAHSPLAFFGTIGPEGQPQVSPKGDVAGFMHVEDDGTLLVPERSGNRLVYTLQNILANGHIAITALAPGTGESLRIEGRAELDDDAALRARFAARGRPALLLIRVRAERSYFQCAKSLLRSGIWNPADWPAPLQISFGREIAANRGLPAGDIDNFDAGVRGRYETDL